MFGAPTLDKNAQELFRHTSILNLIFFFSQVFFSNKHVNFGIKIFNRQITASQNDLTWEKSKKKTYKLFLINPCNEFSLGIIFVTSVIVLFIIIKAASHTMLFIEMIADVRCMALSITFSMVAIIC